MTYASLFYFWDRKIPFSTLLNGDALSATHEYTAEIVVWKHRILIADGYMSHDTAVS
jgi:hypothetical protein